MTNQEQQPFQEPLMKKRDEVTSTTVDDSADVVVKEYTAYDLWQEAWSKAGKSLFYMEFLHPDVDWTNQEVRVRHMCYHLASERKRHTTDTEENRQWFRDWIQKFDDEVENQC